VVCAEKMRKYTFVITEKPDAAQKIASALDQKETPKKLNENGMPYYVATRDRELIIVPALGHLYTVAEEEKKGPIKYAGLRLNWVAGLVSLKG